MVFEYGGQHEVLAEHLGCDQKSYVDMIWQEVSSNAALANGAEPEQLERRAERVDVMDQKIKMGLGISKKSHKNMPGQPIILGEI